MWSGSEQAATVAEVTRLYPDALAGAVKRGLAEADPSDDVLGEDARSKLIILAGLAFDVRLRPADVYVRGIARKGMLTTRSILEGSDLAALRSLGHVPKLLSGAQCQRVNGESRVIAWAQPAAVPATHPLANVTGSENACLLRVESPLRRGLGTRPFQVMLRGAGAGGPETASSVISDIQFCARQLLVAGRIGTEGPKPSTAVYNYGAAAFGRPQAQRDVASLCLTDALVAPFLVRFLLTGTGENQGTVAGIAATLRDSGVGAEQFTVPGAPSSHLYLKTAPSSMRRVERALETVLAVRGSDVALDILYLPLLEGIAWDDLSAAATGLRLAEEE